jgi:hypothetical protein
VLSLSSSLFGIVVSDDGDVVDVVVVVLVLVPGPGGWIATVVSTANDRA